MCTEDKREEEGDWRQKHLYRNVHVGKNGSRQSPQERLNRWRKGAGRRTRTLMGHVLIRWLESLFTTYWQWSYELSLLKCEQNYAKDLSSQVEKRNGLRLNSLWPAKDAIEWDNPVPWILTLLGHKLTRFFLKAKYDPKTKNVTNRNILQRFIYCENLDDL